MPVPAIVACFTLAAIVAFYRRPWLPYLQDATTILSHSPHTDIETHLLSPWKDIVPSKQLKFSDCYGIYQCARLEVPIDWNNESDTDTVALAVLKIPAVVPVTHPNYGGAIVTMPGGPGGSGAHALREHGDLYRDIIDSSEQPKDQKDSSDFHLEPKYFDLIGFDPRGVANTTPAYSCFEDPYARQRWTTDEKRLDLIGTSESAFNSAWSRAEALAKSCTQPGRSKLGHFMNTTPQVADLVALIERLGEWREAEAKSLLRSSAYTQIATETAASTLDRLKWNRGHEKLLYWGFSYSSVLGSTFASMYPDKVGRMILDGICDPRGTYGGIGLDSIIHSEDVFTTFFHECHRAGPERCPLAYISERPDGTQSIVTTILQKLIDSPLAVPATATRGPDIITFSDMKRIVKESLYYPLESFPQLAELISDVINGNGSLVADFKADNFTALVHKDPGYLPYGELILEVLASMLCTDMQDFSNHTQQEFRDFLSQLQQQGYWIGEIWSEFSLPCWHWKARPAWQFQGPWAADPAHPILWIGNTQDPVTPVENAYSMAAAYKGSKVLTYEAAGHCSIAARSKCVTQHVRKYFADGTLPEVGTRCSPDERPFGGS